jgi:hypothetical protein
MSVAVLLAAVAMPFDPAQVAPGPREFPLGENSGGAVADGALFYRSRRARRGVIRRLDLESGANSVVYTAPDRRTHISGLQAGGDRVAFELVSDRVRLLGMGADGTGVDELVRTRDFERRDCGSMVRLWTSRHQARCSTSTPSFRAGATGATAAFSRRAPTPGPER